MFLDKQARLSAQVLGRVLKLPLYDGDCCPAARDCLAAGNVEGAITEWRRLADLGSGRARCVLAYLHLVGAPSIPVNLEEARRIASSAIAGDRGYANYVLGCIALKEHQGKTAVDYFSESHKAGFYPALSMMASMLAQGAGSSENRNETAAKMFLRASAAGHVPARLLWVRLALSGRLGFAQRVMGVLLSPLAFLRYAVGLRHHIFSIHYFQYFPGATVSLFNEEATSRSERLRSTPRRDTKLAVLRWVHTIAATAAAGVLSYRLLFVAPRLATYDASIAGWVIPALLPYGLSYLVASTMDSLSRIAVTVQSLLTILVTVLVCDAYVGRLLDGPLNGWTMVIVTIIQAFLLLMACTAGASAAKRFEPTGDPVPAHRGRVFWAHAILGVLTFGAVAARFSGSYFHPHGLDLIAVSGVALVPYGACAVFSWGLVTTSRWRPWAYISILVAGTVAGGTVYSGALGRITDPKELFGVAIAQLIGFGLVAEWLLDGTEW
jgi:hypothetical protein